MSADTMAIEPEDAVIEQAIMSLPDADNALDAVTEIMMSNPEVFEANQTVAVAILIVAARMDEKLDGLSDLIREESEKTRAAALEAALETVRRWEAGKAAVGEEKPPAAEKPEKGKPGGPEDTAEKPAGEEKQGARRIPRIAVPAALIVVGVALALIGSGIVG